MSSNVYIYDCDGVILDSNHLKVEIVDEVLRSMQEIFPNDKIAIALESFKNNFGKSRYWHIQKFAELVENSKESFKQHFLEKYSQHLKARYHLASVCTGVENILQKSTSDKYIVSGSDQHELREVLKKKKLDIFFLDILGSPLSKSENIQSILRKSNSDKKFFFIGDSFQDMYAAQENNIEFIFYKPYSMVANSLELQAKTNKYCILNSWRDFNEP
jgi:phosphoglycolate phosphatase-like HAD superfamily hydrolase